MGKSNSRRARHLERISYWEQVLSDWEKSNLSKAKFCRDNEITLSAFYLWSKKLKIVSNQPIGPSSEKSTSNNENGFVPIFIKTSEKIKKAHDGFSIRIELPNDINIVIHNLNKPKFIEYVKTLREV